MKAIFACKMYKASKNKDKIKAALSDPLNVELVQQLKSYLDEDSQEILIEQAEAEEAEAAAEEELESEEASDISDDPVSEDDEDTSDGISSDDDEVPDEEIEEATEIKAGECPVKSISEQVDSIKGLLNSRQDTAGVSRMTVKDDEIWIHYNDSINLNNVMEPVISLMNASDYSNLKFNRLARTENAIVFMVSPVQQSIDPVGDETDE